MTERLNRELDELPHRRPRHPRRRGHRAGLRRGAARRSSWSSTPPPSPRTTGRPSDPQADFGDQRQRHPQPARGDPQALPRGDLHLHLDQQGLRRHAEPAAAGSSWRRGSSCPRTTRTSAGSTRRCRSTPTLHSLFGASKAAADLLVQEYGRYFDMPTVCFRGRLPDRAQPRRRPAARLPRLPDEVHRDRRPLHGLRLRGQAGARQPAQRRPGRRLPALPREPAGRRPSTTSAAGASNACSMLEAIEICERIAGRELNWEMSDEARVGDHRWWISDLDEFGSHYGGWRPQRDLETILARSTRPTPSAGPRRRHEALASSSPPTTRRRRSRETVEGIVSTPRARGDRPRGDRRRRLQHRRHRGGGRADRRPSTRRSAACPRPTATASASPSAPASRRSRATRWRS